MSRKPGRGRGRGRGFPIPMRGNELDDIRVELAGEWGFPIPMRGNEIKDAGFSRALSTFPIPMRGNEPASLRREPVCSVVSNPHEG